MQNDPKVFVIDDQSLIATTLTMVLRESGYEVYSFALAEEALRAAELSRPEILISDVFMSGISGADLTFRVRSVCPECKVLLFSEHAPTSDMLREA